MVGGSATVVDQEQLEVDGEMYEKAKAIYDKLVAAKGDLGLTPRSFYISRDDANGAFLEVDGLSIGLEKKAFDLCISMGDGADNALAAILGHELIHYYEKHLFLREKMTKFQSRNQQRSLEVAGGNVDSRELAWTLGKEQENLVKTLTETEADYLGGFLAYSAGFSIANLPELYTKLYESYPIEEEGPGYATLEERKEMATTAHARLSEFIDMYEVANLLTIVGFSEDARLLYKYILQEYQGREVYNNLGVLTVLEALNYFSKEEKEYQLPLTLDFSFGVQSRDPSAAELKLRNQLLHEALEYFRSATTLDVNYTPAYLNQACVHYLLHDDSRAMFFAATEAKDPHRKDVKGFHETAIKADVLIALLKLRAGDETGARALLEEHQAVSGLAKSNLNKLNKTPPRRGRRSRTSGLGWKIGEIERRDIEAKASNTDKARDLEIFGKDEIRVWAGDPALGGAKIYRFDPRRETGRPDKYIMLSDPHDTTLNWDELGVGSSGEDIIDFHGDPEQIMGSVNGEIWKYQDIILFMDKDKKVRRYAFWLP